VQELSAVQKLGVQGMKLGSVKSSSQKYVSHIRRGVSALQIAVPATRIGFADSVVRGAY